MRSWSKRCRAVRQRAACDRMQKCACVLPNPPPLIYTRAHHKSNLLHCRCAALKCRCGGERLTLNVIGMLTWLLSAERPGSNNSELPVLQKLARPREQDHSRSLRFMCTGTPGDNSELGCRHAHTHDEQVDCAVGGAGMLPAARRASCEEPRAKLPCCRPPMSQPPPPRP
jgi:hypothetical protein